MSSDYPRDNSRGSNSSNGQARLVRLSKLSMDSRNYRVPLEESLHTSQEIGKSSRPASSLESDQEFRFKRHKNNQLVGVPSLGERLDNLQSTKDPRWIDNFNSSLPISSAPRNQGLLQNLNSNNTVSQLSSSQPMYNETDGNLDNQLQIQNQSSWLQRNTLQNRQLQPVSSQAQQIYYIPVQTSPQIFSSQYQIHSPYMNQSVPFIPNSSLQPFYPNQLQSQPEQQQIQVQPQPQPQPQPQLPLQLRSQPQPQLPFQYSSQQTLPSQPPPLQQQQQQQQVSVPTQVDPVQQSQIQQQQRQRQQLQQPAVQNSSLRDTNLLPPFQLENTNATTANKATNNTHTNNSQNKSTTNLQYVQNTRKARRSIAEQRGRRLSQLSSRDQMIISPHRDVPEDEFYRHLGNTSFATNLQLRQLFTWCAIRTLEKMQKRNMEMERRFGDVKEGSERMFVESRRIAVGIIRGFVGDLRKDLLDINWDGETESNDEQDVVLEEPQVLRMGEEQGMGLGLEDGDGSKMGLNTDKSELEELFENDGDFNKLNGSNRQEDIDDENADGDNSYYYNGLNIKRIEKTKKRKGESGDTQQDEENDHDMRQDDASMEAKEQKTVATTAGEVATAKRNRKLLPNSKNVKNEQNLIILQDKVEILRAELDNWTQVLDKQNPDTEWDRINELRSSKYGHEQDVVLDIKRIEVPSTQELSGDLSERLNRLRVHSHLLKANMDALTLLTRAKTDLLTKELVFTENKEIRSSERKQLLRGLSRLLARGGNETK